VARADKWRPPPALQSLPADPGRFIGTVEIGVWHFGPHRLESRPADSKPVKAHELYNAVDPALVTQMLNWFRDHDRNVYRSAVSTLAQSKKLRLEFIQKKPLPDQYAWILKTLKGKQADTIGEHLLQAWFMAGNQEMLAKFCDTMGIEHDGKGSVTGDLPESMDAAKLDEAVDTLVGTYDPKLVALYLHVFNLQTPGGWDALTAKLAADARLKLA
jgi:hypothetical protein